MSVCLYFDYLENRALYEVEIWHACCWGPEKVQCRVRSRSDQRFWSSGQKSPFRTDTKERALGPGEVQFSEWGPYRDNVSQLLEIGSANCDFPENRVLYEVAIRQVYCRGPKEVQCRLLSCLDPRFEIAIISTLSYIPKEMKNCWGSEFIVLNKGKPMRFSRISAHLEHANAMCFSSCKCTNGLCELAWYQHSGCLFPYLLRKLKHLR